jgi:UTP--glucose-1-phosphate uridylyltransferase
MKRIRKAVFPVAGLGTRFLPATKAIPKEMLTIVDRPVIQHVVDEACAAGIEHLVFVTGRNKGVIEDHFDAAFKEKEIAELRRDLPAAGGTSFTRQQAPLGLGHAVWCARDIVGDEPFAVLLPDMLHQGAEPCLKGMIEAYEASPSNIIAVYEVPMSETHQYGILGVGSPGKSGLMPVVSMVEKPPKGTAPSNLAVSGRYILEPAIFKILETQKRGAGGEIQLTDAMIVLAKSRPFSAFRFDGRIHDTGTKLGFLTANVAYALERPDLGPALCAEIEAMLG